MDELVIDDQTFSNNDTIKFAVAGVIPGQISLRFLTRLRAHSILAILITEKNGKPLERPLMVRSGFYHDVLPKGVRFETNVNGISFVGLDENCFWTGKVSIGFGWSKLTGNIKTSQLPRCIFTYGLVQDREPVPKGIIPSDLSYDDLSAPEKETTPEKPAPYKPGGIFGTLFRPKA